MTIVKFLLAFFSFMDPTPTTEVQCSKVHGGGACCRIEVSGYYGDGTPIERIVCGPA